MVSERASGREGAGGDGSPADVRPAKQGGDVGPGEGAGAQQAEEDGEAREDNPGENQVLRHLLLRPPGHHRLLRPDDPRPLHSRPRPSNTHSRLRGNKMIFLCDDHGLK